MTSIAISNQQHSYVEWLGLADSSIFESLKPAESTDLRPISIYLSEPNLVFEEILGIAPDAGFNLPILPLSSVYGFSDGDIQNGCQKLVSVLGKIDHLSPRSNNILLEGMFSCPKCRLQQRKVFFKDIYQASLFQLHQLLTESKTDKLSILNCKSIDPHFFSQIECIKSTWKSISKCDTLSCKTPLDSMGVNWKSPENKLFSYYYAR